MTDKHDKAGHQGHVHGPHCNHDHHHHDDHTHAEEHVTDITLDAARLLHNGDAAGALARLAKEEFVLRTGGDGRALALAENLLRKGDAQLATDDKAAAQLSFTEAVALAKTHAPHAHLRQELEGRLAALHQTNLKGRLFQF